ncbi:MULTISPECIES: 1-acyl-sn-glycerol-3-phosphate acyltransferase [unclassified Roseovarius]|uniref:lysophospholipid acyltransferase family protein n=1 Tax=unclassified Roseovarius TaxID=2614913 RepID=UPI00273D7B7A|nr:MULTISPECIES: lysophospholipid acyltransferase family protein [unclassified Roseovarius]
MSSTWNPDEELPLPPITPAGWLRVLVRGVAMVLILVAGVTVALFLRLIEIPFCKQNRPLSPHITQWVARAWFLILGMRHETSGARMKMPGAVVANHASWLDIFTLNARKRIYFVSKSDVAGWPVIGFLARLVGTVFIARDPKQARAQTELFEQRLLSGHKLLFFPEGTSTDGMRVLRFKSTLFQALFSPQLRDTLYVQPVTVIYHAPQGQDPRFYGWWGHMAFGPHLLHVLAAAKHGSVRVIYHDPVPVRDFDGRKALAAHAEAAVRGGMPPERRDL